MSRVLALTKRELLAYFYAPVPYLVVFFFLALVSFFFQGMIGFGEMPGQKVAWVDFGGVFGILGWVLIFLVPLLTMNSVAEERARNTIETLLTAPVRDWQVIASKWMGTMFFYLVMLVPTVVFFLVLRDFGADIGKPDWGSVVCAYTGAVMLGSFYVAIGIFASSVTEDALLSAFVAFFILIAFWAPAALLRSSGAEPQFVADAAKYLSQNAHFEAFLEGRIALHDVLYFALGTALFLFGAVRALESRRWR